MKNRVGVLVSAGLVRIEEHESPKPREGEVLIKVKAAGICSGDIYAFKGLPVWFTLPAPFGHEPVGDVVEVGPNVTGFKPGDKVIAIGSPAYADYLVAKASSVAKIPSNIPYEYAIGEPLAAIVNVIRVTQPRLGDYVAVVGSGYMGLLLTQALRGMGFSELAVFDIIDDRLKLAKEFGATATVNPTVDDVDKVTKELTNGNGFNVVFEVSGNPNGVDLATRIIGRRGRLSIVSYHSLPVQVNFRIWDAKGIDLVMAVPARSGEEYATIDLRIAAKLLERGVFNQEKLITHEWRLDQLQEALEYASKKPKEYIKGVIIP
ncbi:MDR/zinc-dependent alcohol dehydrogenase-like family protein [Caldivirga maquilingensis]|uniref:Alcohol dehydrogenase GroES domain protein n=1 Tax=Caldivirga maquilingensis (strain ATCC 700844 / DSM 13496 / JCM 10307 / IC-167) TaxID=397948 RepID=A8MAC3_CALMQ|nr:zinc-binding dehydrogenase [Caldivirga maquilingensis]ABW02500.1 Alcohol dehydrogenase GroES domain protein [Caldivirga maquilingensis IC-167]